MIARWNLAASAGVVLVAFALLAAGCGRKESAEHAHEGEDHAHEHEDGAAHDHGDAAHEHEEGAAHDNPHETEAHGNFSPAREAPGHDDHAHDEGEAHDDHGHGGGEHGHEGETQRVVLKPEAIEKARIRTGVAKAATIHVSIETPGEVRLNEERVLHVRARFGGLVRALPHRLGDDARAGDTLAVIQSNESLSDFAVTAAQSGTVIARNATVGETVTPETVLATVADFSSVWVDFAIYPQNAARVQRGQTVVVHSTSGDDRKQEGKISYVGPLLEQDTRVSYGRVVLSNNDGFWRPGLFVTVRVLVDRAEVAVAVPEDAIVRSKQGPAVFLAASDTFTLQPVVLGRTDGTLAEVVSGLDAGATVVVENAFILKAELGKSEAHHDH